ncbi:MAG: hypothetical protein NT015_01805 [Alphaproteobacteria bacterium]|nr:hypothetical protein [Alphaproteobacteria bacterium]
MISSAPRRGPTFRPQAAGGEISGFSRNQETQARRHLQVGDTFLCYIVKLGRWCGALQIESTPFVDDTPLFKPTDDPFVVRLRVRPLIMLSPEHAVPQTLPEVWNTLSFTKDVVPGSVGWGAHFQRSLRRIPDDDAAFLMGMLSEQAQAKKNYPLSTKDRRALEDTATVMTATGNISVAIPDDNSDETSDASPAEARESHQIQGILADLGAKMGFRVWLPKADRERVLSTITDDVRESLIDQLPMNYNEATVRTIEQIDVLWLRGRSIARAFEVEHTTAIYSGLLRMADLVALQPDIRIPLHIVAPASRTEAVLEQIRRPVFSLLDTGRLGERCSLLTYDAVREIVELPHVQHLRDQIISEYQIDAEE